MKTSALWRSAALGLALLLLAAVTERASGQFGREVVLVSNPLPYFQPPAFDARSGAPPAPLPPFLPEGAVKLTPDEEVWVERERGKVILGGQVCLRTGMLEMFACPWRTKEHESIVTIRGKAQTAHAGLLLVGALPGTPVRFRPDYAPATGMEVEVTVAWMDTSGRFHEVRAQDWIRETKSKAPMKQNWVFAGSGFWTDPTTGISHYQGESGDFICVSNFPSATLDLPIQSSDLDSALLFEANTEKIPPLDTPVHVVLSPKLTP